MANNLSIIITRYLLFPRCCLLITFNPSVALSSLLRFLPLLVSEGGGGIQLDESFFSLRRRSDTLPLSFICGSLRCLTLCSFCCCVVLTRGGVSSAPEHQRTIALRLLLLPPPRLLLFLFVFFLI